MYVPYVLINVMLFFLYFFVTFKYAYACVIHVLCNHYQLWYSTITVFFFLFSFLYYTTIKRYSISRQCTRSPGAATTSTLILLRFSPRACNNLRRSLIIFHGDSLSVVTLSFPQPLFFVRFCQCSYSTPGNRTYPPTQSQLPNISDEGLPSLFLFIYFFHFTFFKSWKARLHRESRSRVSSVL